MGHRIFFFNRTMPILSRKVQLAFACTELCAGCLYSLQYLNALSSFLAYGGKPPFPYLGIM